MGALVHVRARAAACSHHWAKVARVAVPGAARSSSIVLTAQPLLPRRGRRLHRARHRLRRSPGRFTRAGRHDRARPPPSHRRSRPVSLRDATSTTSPSRRATSGAALDSLVGELGGTVLSAATASASGRMQVRLGDDDRGHEHRAARAVGRRAERLPRALPRPPRRRPAPPHVQGRRPRGDARARAQPPATRPSASTSPTRSGRRRSSIPREAHGTVVQLAESHRRLGHAGRASRARAASDGANGQPHVVAGPAARRPTGPRFLRRVVMRHAVAAGDRSGSSPGCCGDEVGGAARAGSSSRGRAAARVEARGPTGPPRRASTGSKRTWSATAPSVSGRWPGRDAPARAAASCRDARLAGLAAAPSEQVADEQAEERRADDHDRAAPTRAER